MARLDHHQHALLALREHHLVGAHAVLAAGHGVEVELHAEVALGAHLDRRAGQARRAHVLDRVDMAGRHDLEAGLEQELLGEGVADLHGRALLLGALVEGGRRHGRAMDAVAAGLGTEIDDRLPHARGLGVENLVGPRDADRHGVDQDVAVIAAVETGQAADIGHAEGIAVAADAGHHARDEMARARMVRRAEAQRIEHRDRPRAHREDVAQDAADTRRRALVGLDEGGVVVALHLEDDGEAVADVDHAGILARALDDPGRLGRQRLQMDLRGLVRAVLVPHRRDDAELGDRGLAPDQMQEALVLVGLQAVFGDELRRDLDVVGNHGARVPAVPAARPVSMRGA